jgi:hypothetical protein
MAVALLVLVASLTPRLGSAARAAQNQPSRLTAPALFFGATTPSVSAASGAGATIERTFGAAHVGRKACRAKRLPFALCIMSAAPGGLGRPIAAPINGARLRLDAGSASASSTRAGAERSISDLLHTGAVIRRE